MKAFFELLRKLTTALLISIVVVVVVVLVVKKGQINYFQTLKNNLSYSLYSYISKYFENRLPDKILSVTKTGNTSEAENEVCSEKDSLKMAKECTLLIGDVEKHGSGFVISPGNYLVTNYHVIDHFSEGYANVYYNGQFHTLRIAGFSIDDDLAIIRLETAIPYCAWADSQSLELAENVYAVGWPNSPYGESTITKGIFSRYTTLENKNIQMIQTDTPVNPGNSGGPLINSCGVVGINTSKTNWIDELSPSEGIGYSISSQYAQNLIEQLIQNDDGSPKVPAGTTANEQDTDVDNTPQPETSNYLNPNSFVAYNYDQVMFWEAQRINDQALLKSWEKAIGSEYVSEDKLDDLLDNLTRSLAIANILWDGYTNSKITYVQVLGLKQEYLLLSHEFMYMTNDLNTQGSINAYKNCVESWNDLEEEYDADYSEQIEKCGEILDTN